MRLILSAIALAPLAACWSSATGSSKELPTAIEQHVDAAPQEAIVDSSTSGGDASKAAAPSGQEAECDSGEAAAASDAPADPRAAERSAVSINALAADLSAILLDARRNVVVSPASVAFAIAAASEGANGKTRESMLRVLHFASAAEARLSVGALATSLNRHDDSYALDFRGSVWLNSDLSISTAVRSNLALLGAGAIHQVDFEHAPEQARDAIDTWGRCVTRGLIPVGIPADAIDGRTRVVVASAAYLRAPWAQPFIPTFSVQAPFRAPGRKVLAHMMRRTNRVRYARAPRAQIIELPYIGDLSMIVVLPDADGGLLALESGSIRELAHSVTALTAQWVDLELPSWQTTSEWDADLAKALQLLGMGVAFERKADFSNFGPNLRLAKAIQQATIRVDEGGTEAAAITKMGATFASFDRPPDHSIVFHADHPFLYLLRDRTTGAILFVGHVVNAE